MLDDDLIITRIKELRNQYDQTERQLYAIGESVNNLEKCASQIIKADNFSNEPIRISNKAWRRRASETIRELMRVDRVNYPTFDSVLISIYIKLRDVYGVVFDQLRKDYKYKYNMLCFPSAFEAISDDNTVRDIFDSLLVDMFPESYFNDEAIETLESRCESTNGEYLSEEMLIKIIQPLAIKMGDNSYGYINTFNHVCSQMDCSWSNLQTRYMNKNGLSEPPHISRIILDNVRVLRKFKRTTRIMIDQQSKA